MPNQSNYCTQHQFSPTKGETPGSAANAHSGVSTPLSKNEAREPYTRQEETVNREFRVVTSAPEERVGQGSSAPSEATHREHSEGERGALPLRVGSPLSGWSEPEIRTGRRYRTTMLRQTPTEHWTTVRCWHESGEELSALERFAVLRMIFDGRGDEVPDAVLFFDPALADQWGMRELFRVPHRDEILWSYFPAPKPSDPEPTVERSEVLAGPRSALPRPPGREATNAGAFERPQGQSANTYPVACGDRSFATQHQPGERTR